MSTHMSKAKLKRMIRRMRRRGSICPLCHCPIFWRRRRADACVIAMDEDGVHSRTCVGRTMTQDPPRSTRSPPREYGVDPITRVFGRPRPAESAQQAQQAQR